MSTTKSMSVFNINGLNLSIIVDEKNLREGFKQTELEWEEGRFTKAFTSDVTVTKEAYMEDIARGRAFLDSIEEDPSILEAYVKDLRKKKNGEFWKGSVNSVLRFDNISIYYTDFTNAWSVLDLRVKVRDFQTCELELIRHSLTN